MIKKRRLLAFLCLLTASSLFSGKEVYARYESSEDDAKPFVERDFSFMEAGDEGVETDVWQSYNANVRSCTSHFKPYTSHSKYSEVKIYTESGIQTAPYVAYFTSNCSNDATWQRNNHNVFFRELYGKMIVYMPVSISYPSSGANTMKKVYENALTPTNLFKSTFVKWGVPLNSNRCGYGYTYADGCRPAHSGGSGKETYPSGAAGEWENLGYSGDGYPIINSHFPTNYPKSPGTLASYGFDATYGRTDKTSYDTATSGEKYTIKYNATSRLMSKESLSGSVASWMKKLSLKNNASTEAGIFKGTRNSGKNYTIAVTEAKAEARYNLVLERVQLIYGGSVVGSYTRSALQENGTQSNPSSNLYGGKTYTLKFKIKNDSPVALNRTYSVNYTVNGTTYTKTADMNLGAGNSGEFSVDITVPNENKSFDITAVIPSDEYNLWNVDDKATIRVTTYRDTSAPTITSAGVTTGCSTSSATISVSSTDNPTNNYASGYSHTILTKPDGGTETSWGNPATFNVYSDGSYKVVSCDKNGNCTGTRTVGVNTIDKQKPTASVSGIPSNWVNTNVTATVTGTDPSHNCSGIAKAWWRINNGSWQYKNSTTASVTLTESGAHKFDYAVTDRVGHDSPTLSTTVYIDKERPTINSLTPVGTTSSSGMLLVGGSATSVTYDLTVTDVYSGVKSYNYAWNNNPWLSYEIAWPGNRLTVPISGAVPNQINELWFRVMDGAGNWRTWTPGLLYDTIGPTINQSQIVITPYYNNKTTANVKVTAKDNFQDAGYTYVKYIYLSNDNSNWTKYTATNNSINVNWNTRTPDGTYTLYVKAEDSLGNIGAVQTQTYVTDQTKPTGSITIGGGQNHFPNESVRLNFTYGDNLSGVSKIEIYDINNGTASSSVHTINNPSTQKSLDWVLKPYTATDGSIRAQVGMKVTDNAGNVTTVTSKEIYISRVTIQDFHLTNVVNPTVYNKSNPFRRLTHPNIPEQKLLAGGSFNFESNYIYPLGTVHNSWRVTHTATIQYHYPNGTIRNIEMTDSKVTFSGRFSKMHEIPFDVPVGTKVYIKINVKLHDSYGGVFTQDDFPKPTGSLIYLGKIQDDIRNVINFNEIK